MSNLCAYSLAIMPSPIIHEEVKGFKQLSATPSEKATAAPTPTATSHWMASMLRRRIIR
jgi:hypothetical protein